MLKRGLLVCFFAVSVACGDNGGDDDSTAIDAAEIDTAVSEIDAPDPTGDGATTDTPGSQSDAAVGTLCGQMTCTTAQECCVQGQGRTCVAAGSCQGVNFDCDGPEDCDSGEVCCYGGGGNGGTSCTTAASCPAPTCSTATDCPTQGQMCCTIGQLQVCAMTCPGP
jgi:hypothetical protein